MVKCDSNAVGKDHRRKCVNCCRHETICVTRESDGKEREDIPSESKLGNKQFPLRLSWTMAVHK